MYNVFTICFIIGMQTLSAQTAPRWTTLIENLRNRIAAPEFCVRHRLHDTDFTRQRTFTFPIVVLLLLQKTTRSLQRHLHSFFDQLPIGAQATGSAWTQARAKFSHGALIELNQQMLVAAFYSAQTEPWRRAWRGHRLLGVDGSLVRLPNHKTVAQRFSSFPVTNQHGDTGATYSQARLSVLYDLLNHVGLETRMESLALGEVDMAVEHLGRLQGGDLLIWDRGYTGFILMAQTLARGAHFVGRCSTRSFGPAQQLFADDRDGRSLVVELPACSAARGELRAAGLPMTVTVRFVSLRLNTGELEVLVTSLLSAADYPTQEFLKVYHWRWNHETYYQMLKGRLDLENWTGQTVEAVLQDLHAATLVANLETLLSQEPQEALSAGDHERKHPARINRSVSYHALKERIIDLLWDRRRPVDHVLGEVQQWMRRNPVCQRMKRNPGRGKIPPLRSYQFQRNIRKNVF